MHVDLSYTMLQSCIVATTCRYKIGTYTYIRQDIGLFDHTSCECKKVSGELGLVALFFFWLEPNVLATSNNAGLIVSPDTFFTQCTFARGVSRICFE